MSNSQRSDSAPANKLPYYTWLGIAVLLAGETSFLLEQQVMIKWFTPIMWTGYILAVDGWLYKRTGTSWLKDHIREFPFLLIASVGIWVLFEVFNFHLQNWYYQSVPTSPALRLLSYFWSFATIIPGVFLTSQVIESYFQKINRSGEGVSEIGDRSLWFIVGLAMVILPITVPISLARYLFGSVWIGFILLVDPMNERIGAPSIRKMIKQGKYVRILALLAGGFVCGLIWEAWNFQAFMKGGGHWVYTVPESLRIFGLHYGQMPVLGMLGFPPFALELYAMYHFFREMIDGPRVLGPYYW